MLGFNQVDNTDEAPVEDKYVMIEGRHQILHVATHLVEVTSHNSIGRHQIKSITRETATIISVLEISVIEMMVILIPIWEIDPKRILVSEKTKCNQTGIF